MAVTEIRRSSLGTQLGLRIQDERASFRMGVAALPGAPVEGPVQSFFIIAHWPGYGNSFPSEFWESQNRSRRISSMERRKAIRGCTQSTASKRALLATWTTSWSGLFRWSPPRKQKTAAWQRRSGLSTQRSCLSFWGLWQREVERAALVDLALHPDLAPVRLDDRTSDRQA